MRSTSPLFVACSLGLALSGCHGSSAPTTPALEDEGAPPPADLLVAPAGAYGSVILHEGAPYLFVSFAHVYEGSEPPAPAGPAPATVALLTPEGSCTAHVGEPVSLSTGECETSTTIARPLTGCAGPVARVARVQGAWPEGVRFMPLDEPDPKARLEQMHQRMARIKNSDEAVLTFGLQRVVSMSPGQIAFFLTNFFANKAVGVLTNVPGPTGLLRFAGQEVEQVVGFAPCSGNQPMTATIFSYNGGVTIGFATDAGLIPNPEDLVRYVMEDLDRMQAELA